MPATASRYAEQPGRYVPLGTWASAGDGSFGRGGSQPRACLPRSRAARRRRRACTSPRSRSEACSRAAGVLVLRWRRATSATRARSSAVRGATPLGREVIWSWDPEHGLRDLRPGPLRPRCGGLRRERRRRHRRDDADAHEHRARLHHDCGGDGRPRHARRRLEPGRLAINNHDQVVGEANRSPTGALEHAFLWTPGSGDARPGNAGRLRQSTRVCRERRRRGGGVRRRRPRISSRAFRWRNGRMTMLAGLGGHVQLRARRSTTRARSWERCKHRIA